MLIEVPDLTGAECGDIAITAAEGGIGYWSQIVSRYDPNSWVDQDVADAFVFYTLEWEGRQPEEELIAVTPTLIRRGFEIALKDRPMRRDLQEQLVDREEVDAEVADCIVQLGAFGEIVFG